MSDDRVTYSVKLDADQVKALRAVNCFKTFSGIVEIRAFEAVVRQLKP